MSTRLVFNLKTNGFVMNALKKNKMRRKFIFVEKLSTLAVEKQTTMMI